MKQVKVVLYATILGAFVLAMGSVTLSPLPTPEDEIIALSPLPTPEDEIIALSPLPTPEDEIIALSPLPTPEDEVRIRVA
ncbi:MAG: hypothetical protein ABL967_05350 [Bryobacteraceae bacterium]